MSDAQEQALPPMGVQVILTAEAEVIRGGAPAEAPADERPDDEEQA